MESSAEHVVPDPLKSVAPPRLNVIPERALDASEDLYAQTELERRMRRIELIIEKAHKIV
jgi:hypothetical protein